VCRQLCKQDSDGSQLSDVIKDLADENSLSVRLSEKTATENYYVGRIRYGTVKGKLTCQNIYLEVDSKLSNQVEVIRLDLSLFKIDNDERKFSLFPGQIVVIKGQKPNGNILHVSEFVELRNILPSRFSIE